MVSHDRYLVDKLTDHLFIFEGNGYVRTYNGNYTDYRVEKEEEDELEKARLKAEKNQAKQVAQNTPIVKKRSFKEQKELDDLEERIKQLENRKAEINNLLLSITNVDEIIALSKELEDVISDLDAKELRWLELSN